MPVHCSERSNTKSPRAGPSQSTNAESTFVRPSASPCSNLFNDHNTRLPETTRGRNNHHSFGYSLTRITQRARGICGKHRQRPTCLHFHRTCPKQQPNMFDLRLYNSAPFPTLSHLSTTKKRTPSNLPLYTQTYTLSTSKMHFLTLLLTSVLAATLAMASPAPMPLPERFEPPWPATGPLSGSLPKNMAKIWVFDDMKCDDNGGRTYMVNVMPGQDRCLAFTNVGSIFSWFKSDIG